MKTKKGNVAVIALIVAVVAVSAGVIGYMFAKKTQAPEIVKDPAGPPSPKTELAQPADETADWQTYRNEEYGFEFKYPINWMLSEDKGNNFDLPIVDIVSPETQELIKDRKIPYVSDLSIYYYPSVADESENKLNGLGATTVDELIERNTLITKIGSTEIGGIPATDVVWGGESLYYTILVERNSHLYKLWFGNINTKDKLTLVENNILSTFKFTK
ncbi:MAG TPA: hypothetical protein DD454_00925 [Candidatus Moranbacteria bacterium]|nr:hypothetical protein [Candidatus Moranbacteria bacterium]